MRSSFAAAGALAWLCLPASAAEEFITGVYLQTEQLCAEAKQDSLQTVLEAGNTVLSSRGIESVEYNCEFVQDNAGDPSRRRGLSTPCARSRAILSPDVLTIVEMSSGPTRPRIGQARSIRNPAAAMAEAIFCARAWRCLDARAVARRAARGYSPTSTFPGSPRHECPSTSTP